MYIECENTFYHLWTCILRSRLYRVRAFIMFVSFDIIIMMYTLLLKKPDTFCLLKTRKLQIIDLNVYAYFNKNTSENIFGAKHDVITSKIHILSLLSRECMSK